MAERILQSSDSVVVDESTDGVLKLRRAAMTGAVTSAQDSNNTVLTDGAVTTAKIADLAVTGAKFANSSITSAKLASGAATADKLAVDAVTETKIAAGAVTATKLADQAVIADKLATDAVATAKILDDAVTFAKMQNIATDTVIGRSSASTGSPEEVPCTATGRSLMAAASATAAAAILAGLTTGSLIAIIEDQKPSGTNGGTFTSGTQTRTLNTLVYNRDTIVTLSSNQFTLPAGAWDINWEAQAVNVNAHQSLLHNVTDASVVNIGMTMIASTETSVSSGAARVSIASSKAFELRHRCQTTQANTGFGQPGSLGTEVYSRVTIRRA